MRQRNIAAILVLVLVAAILLPACATSTIGKAVQVAEVQKTLVEDSAVAFIKLHMRGTVSDADYAKGKALYTKWASGQKALAETLAAWRVISSPDNETKLQNALGSVRDLTEAYLAFVSLFVDLDKLKR